jgi:hypothetical protein
MNEASSAHTFAIPPLSGEGRWGLRSSLCGTCIHFKKKILPLLGEEFFSFTQCTTLPQSTAQQYTQLLPQLLRESTFRIHPSTIFGVKIS